MIKAIPNRAVSIYRQASLFQCFVLIANEITDAIIIGCRRNIRGLPTCTLSFVDVFSRRYLCNFFKEERFPFYPPILFSLAFKRFLKTFRVVLSISASTSCMNEDMKSKSISPLSLMGSNIFSRFIRSSFISLLKLYFSDKRLIIGTMKR